MLDTAVAFNRYPFIGYEFLTWLWFTIDHNPIELKKYDENLEFFTIGNRIVLENRTNDSNEIIIIKGDDADLEEAFLALHKGAIVIEINLFYQSNGNKWNFTLKGDNLSFSGLQIPKTEFLDHQDDMDGIILDRIFLYEKVFDLVSELFNNFCKLRTNMAWIERTVPDIKNWIKK